MGTKLDPGIYCAYSKLADDEPYFCLAARDPMAPTLIRRWATVMEEEIANGLRPPYGISRVHNARRVADEFERWYAERETMLARAAAAA